MVDADAAILRYTQPTNMTFLQYGKDQFSITIRLGDFCEKLALNNIFIEDSYKSTCYSLHKYWSSNGNVDLTDFPFEARSLLAIQR